MSEADINSRLSHIENRLDLIEKLLESRRGIPVPPTPLEKERMNPDEFWKSPTIPTVQPRTSSAPPSLPFISYTREKTRPPPPQGAIEQAIGLKWAGWIGALVLVIGTGFGIRYAYDHGWFSSLPATLRLSVFALFGCALIATGEWVYRKINVLSATGLYAAGVAVFYLVSYLGHGHFNLYDSSTAFTFMIISTLIGAAIAMRGNLVSIAALSIIGGNLAPLILGDEHHSITGLLRYELMLVVVSLFLACWGQNEKWWALRGICFTGAAIWFAPILFSPSIKPTDAPLWFALVSATLFHAELVLSAFRRKGQTPPSVDPAIGVPFSFLVTAALTAVTLYLFRNDSESIRVLWVLLYAAVTAGISLTLAQDKSSKLQLKHLSLSYYAQSATLVAIAVPIALSGIWVAAGWSILAITMGIIATQIDSRPTRTSSALAWVLSAFYIVWWTGFDPHATEAHHALFRIMSVNIPRYAIACGLLALAGHVVAFLALNAKGNDREGNIRQSNLITAIAATYWIGAALAALPPLGATSIAVLYAWILFAADLLPTSPSLPIQSVVIASLAALKWILLDTLRARLSPHWVAADLLPVFNISFGTGLLIAGTFYMQHRLWRDRLHADFRTDQASTSLSIAFATIILILWTGSFEIDRILQFYQQTSTGPFSNPELAEEVALSIFWSLFAIGLVIAGFRFRLAPLRIFGLCLFGITLLKVFTIDLAQLSTGYRILSFFGLGGLLLGTSVIYGKLTPVLLRSEPIENPLTDPLSANDSPTVE